MKSNNEKVQVDYEEGVDDSDYGGDSDYDYDEDGDNEDGYLELENGVNIDPSRLLKILVRVNFFLSAFRDPSLQNIRMKNYNLIHYFRMAIHV